MVTWPGKPVEKNPTIIILQISRSYREVEDTLLIIITGNKESEENNYSLQRLISDIL